MSLYLLQKPTKNEKLIPEKFKDHAWFVATAPKDNPKITVAILAEHGGGGGSVAAPIANKIINAYLENNYEDIRVSSELVEKNIN